MSKKLLEFNGFNIDIDTVQTPAVRQIFERLHLFMPSIFPPHLLNNVFTLWIVAVSLCIASILVSIIFGIEDIGDGCGNLHQTYDIEMTGHHDKDELDNLNDK